MSAGHSGLWIFAGLNWNLFPKIQAGPGEIDQYGVFGRSPPRHRGSGSLPHFECSDNFDAVGRAGWVDHSSFIFDVFKIRRVRKQTSAPLAGAAAVSPLALTLLGGFPAGLFNPSKLPQLPMIPDQKLSGTLSAATSATSSNGTRSTPRDSANWQHGHQIRLDSAGALFDGQP